MGWELHIVRTEHWFDSASAPISSEEWLQLVNDDKELSIDNKNGDFFATWSGHCELDEPWLHAVVVDEDDHKYSLPSDLMNPSWANSSPTDKKTSLWGRLISKVKNSFLSVV